MADLDEVANLLHVHEKASAHGDLLSNIAKTAMARLRVINEEHGKAPGPVVEADAEHEPTTDEHEDHDDGQ